MGELALGLPAYAEGNPSPDSPPLASDDPCANSWGSFSGKAPIPAWCCTRDVVRSTLASTTLDQFGDQ